MTKPSFREAIQSGKILVADGAMGTNLLPLGLPKGVSGEAFMLEKPEAILTVHRAFAAAGADILLTCTFGGTSIRLEAAGLKGRAAEVNRRAVELAREAGGDAVYVAGSLGPTGQMMQPFGPLAPEVAQAAFAEQARLLAEAGVDLLVVETQFDLGEAEAAVRGARSASDLPLVCSFSFDRGVRTMMGVRPAQMAKAVTEWGADLAGVNCGRSLEENLKVLAEVRAATTLPIWFKPNAGLPHIEDLAAVYDVTPEMMAACVPDWLAAGAQVVGGCCGTSPAHLAAIAGAVKNRS
jgi:5-methyltetrahydrofolate--homocysteine methyltransferase